MANKNLQKKRRCHESDSTGDFHPIAKRIRHIHLGSPLRSEDLEFGPCDPMLSNLRVGSLDHSSSTPSSECSSDASVGDSLATNLSPLSLGGASCSSRQPLLDEHTAMASNRSSVGDGGGGGVCNHHILNGVERIVGVDATLGVQNGCGDGNYNTTVADDSDSPMTSQCPTGPLHHHQHHQNHHHHPPPDATTTGVTSYCPVMSPQDNPHYYSINQQLYYAHREALNRHLYRL